MRMIVIYICHKHLNRKFSQCIYTSTWVCVIVVVGCYAVSSVIVFFSTKYIPSALRTRPTKTVRDLFENVFVCVFLLNCVMLLRCFQFRSVPHVKSNIKFLPDYFRFMVCSVCLPFELCSICIYVLSIVVVSVFECFFYKDLFPILWLFIAVSSM